MIIQHWNTTAGLAIPKHGWPHVYMHSGVNRLSILASAPGCWLALGQFSLLGSGLLSQYSIACGWDGYCASPPPPLQPCRKSVCFANVNTLYRFLEHTQNGLHNFQIVPLQTSAPPCSGWPRTCSLFCFVFGLCFCLVLVAFVRVRQRKFLAPLALKMINSRPQTFKGQVLKVCLRQFSRSLPGKYDLPPLFLYNTEL